MDFELCPKKKQFWSENTITTNVLKHPKKDGDLLTKVSVNRSGLHTFHFKKYSLMSKNCDNRGFNATSNTMWFNHTLAMIKFKILYVIKEFKNKDQFVYYVNVLWQAENKR